MKTTARNLLLLGCSTAAYAAAAPSPGDARAPAIWGTSACWRSEAASCRRVFPQQTCACVPGIRTAMCVFSTLIRAHRWPQWISVWWGTRLPRTGPPSLRPSRLTRGRAISARRMAVLVANTLTHPGYQPYSTVANIVSVAMMLERIRYGPNNRTL
ncbi:hypothetical protein LZ32DRAFT_29077 [Colletotrichum eremochloae]|nr:hypothetical protein LZ32DRAFT_29077 [Colletotrichum eremochloae]